MSQEIKKRRMTPSISLLLTTSNDEDDTDGFAEDNAFWNHLVIASYQGGTSEDGDPDTESGPPLGTTYKGGFPLITTQAFSLVYLEIIRETVPILTLAPDRDNADEIELYEDAVSRVTAHEIGHVPGDKSETQDHNEMGFMGDQGGDGINPPTVKRFRETDFWR